MYKFEVMEEMSRLVGVPLSKETPIKPGELERILDQLKNYSKPDHFVVKGERPVLMERPSESRTMYRRRMSEFIRRNTGIELPAYSTIHSTFFNAIAKYLGLYDGVSCPAKKSQ